MHVNMHRITPETCFCKALALTHTHCNQGVRVSKGFALCTASLSMAVAMAIIPCKSVCGYLYHEMQFYLQSLNVVDG
jgi:hypothetical protein